MIRGRSSHHKAARHCEPHDMKIHKQRPSRPQWSSRWGRLVKGLFSSLWNGTAQSSLGLAWLLSFSLSFLTNNYIYVRYTTWWSDIHVYSEMIIMIKLSNKPPPLLTCVCACMVRASEIYSVSKFPAFNTVMLIMVIMLHLRSLGLTDIITATLYILTSTFPFALPPCPGDHCSSPCFHDFDIFRFHVIVRSCNTVFFFLWLAYLT